MVNVIRLRSKTGIVTRAYPVAAEAAPATFRGQVQLDTGRCSGDAACARVCPAAAISVDHDKGGWTWTLTDARCVFCGLCQESCQSGAITLSSEFELATQRSADLVTSVRIEGGRSR